MACDVKLEGKPSVVFLRRRICRIKSRLLFVSIWTRLTPENFPPFAFFLKGFGLIPNLFRAQSLRPDVLEAEAAAIRKILQPDDILSRLQKECILLVGSAANLNTYCVAAHCEMLRVIGNLSVEESDQIAVDHHQANLS